MAKKRTPRPIKVYEGANGGMFVAKQPVIRWEELIQRPVVNFLEKMESFRRELTFFHIPNQLLRTPRLRQIYKGLGVRAGVPDIALPIRGGRMLWIELKRERNKKKRGKEQTSDGQNEFHEVLRRLGHPVYVVQEKDGMAAIMAIKEILAQHGLHDYTLTHPSKDDCFEWNAVRERFKTVTIDDQINARDYMTILKALEICGRLGLQS